MMALTLDMTALPMVFCLDHGLCSIDGIDALDDHDDVNDLDSLEGLNSPFDQGTIALP